MSHPERGGGAHDPLLDQTNLARDEIGVFLRDPVTTALGD
jgi:hypothetical protein